MHSKTRLLAPPRVVLCILASIMMYIFYKMHTIVRMLLEQRISVQ